MTALQHGTTGADTDHRRGAALDAETGDQPFARDGAAVRRRVGGGATHSWDFAGLKQISNAICGAVCVGGDLATRGEFRPHFDHRSADVIQLDIGAVGITGALELADAAYGYELPVTLAESPGNIHAHLAGVMPYFMSMEVVDPVARSACLLDRRAHRGGMGDCGRRARQRLERGPRSPAAGDGRALDADRKIP